MTSEERIKKLREEVQSLRSLLDRTQKRSGPTNKNKTESKPQKNRQKPNPKKGQKDEDDIPPF